MSCTYKVDTGEINMKAELTKVQWTKLEWSDDSGDERAFDGYSLGTPETSFKGRRTRNARSALTSNALSSSDARNVLINLLTSVFTLCQLRSRFRQSQTVIEKHGRIYWGIVDGSLATGGGVMTPTVLGPRPQLLLRGCFMCSKIEYMLLCAHVQKITLC